MTESKSRELLRRVAARKFAADLAARLQLFVLILAIPYCLLLLASRLGGIIPDWFDPLMVIVVPAGALLCAGLFRRRPDATEPARLADSALKTDDLFLTAVLIEGSPRGYGPLVLEAAEETAASAEPRAVVPWRPWPGVRSAAAVLVALLAATLFLPRLDPFGREEARRRMAERRKKVADSRKATALRSAILKKDSEGPASRELKRLEAELKKALLEMRPKQKRANLSRLRPIQGEMGRLWRQTAKKRLADALRRSPTAQRFGGSGGRKVSEWKRELRAGRTDALRRELGELKEQVRKMSETKDPAAREKLRREVASRLQSLREFARSGVSSEALERALARACRELEMSGGKGLSKQALEALQSSLDLTEQELAALARTVRELQTLEDALATMQMAKALNDLGALDGKGGGGCKGISDYAALYRSLLAQMGGQGRGMGPGMRGPGTGMGGQAPEDETLDTEYKSRLSRSAMTAGKMLMQWKTKGIGKRGRAREDFLRSVRDVKQGCEEAILREQVPPGYREAIKKYFDSIEEAVEEAVDAGSAGKPPGPPAGGADE